MKITAKITSIILTLCLIVSVAAVGVVPAAADTTYTTYAQDTIQGSNILHCFDWSYSNIKAKLPEIAAAGYTAVQTSPVQRPKDYNSSWTDGVNQWWKLYQPLGLSIASSGQSWLGSSSELTALCTEADKYNIKVVVDIVANHLANNGTDGGTYSYINSGVESGLKHSEYYHTNNTRTNDDSRYNITQYHLGMPDLNTGNSAVQQKALNLLKACIDCGVDGFRFDAAKHIETPTDDSSFASQFWPYVINGAKDYAEDNGCEEPFFYGEILGSAGPDFGISNYTTYMAVTDNQTGDRALDKAYWTAAGELADGTYMKGASADKSVLWVESHDAYMGSSGSAWVSNTKDITSDVINKAWAIVGARADSTALFFARPNNTMGAASSDLNWKSDEVREVNKFKNHFVGTSEYLASKGNTAYIERGSKGVVISKLDGGGSVNLTANQMADGTYTDQITGNTFTVASGKITGTVGSSGIAVVYNPDEDLTEYINESTLYLKPNSNWTQASARFAMYVYNSTNGAYSWVSMTSADSGHYSADVPEGSWTNVIFVRMNPSSDENRWDAYEGENHVWNKTNDLFPDTGTNCYTIASGAWTEGDGSWSLYSGSQQPTSAPATAAPTDPSSNTYTIYAINNAKWSKVAVHYWGDGETSWPGVDMTSVAGNKVYSFEVPKDVSGIVFTNGASSSTKQTGDITSGISDGAVWTIGSASSNNYPVSTPPDYYLVGTMNSWSRNNNYKFSIHANTDGKLEYKLSGVQLAANAEFKVNSSSNSWYPSGSNHTVSSAGVYDVYFRPNGDGGSTWLADGSDSSKHYMYLADVTPCTVTWQIDSEHILATDSVPKGSAPAYTGDTPAKDPSESTIYTFKGWKKTGDDTLYTDSFPETTGDVTYMAQFDESVRKYTVTWKNYDGTILETDEAEYGSAPVYSGDTPTRPNDGATTYVFAFWSPQITSETVITDDTTYTARFGTNTKTYTITWLDGDGNTLRTETCIQGVTPQYTGAEPTKTATAQYSYTFNHTWDPPLVAADGDTAYTAQFDSTVNKYAVTWKDGNGWTLKTDQVEYGTTPSYSGTTPTKDADADYTYSFNNTWSPEIVPVTQAATYTAQFDATPIPMWTVRASNVVDWDDVYIYYWTNFGDNSWPGVKMTADSDNLVMTAQIPSNANGIVFNNGASSNTEQTVNVTNISDGAHWAILDEMDETEDTKYAVHAVPTYYLVGSMTNWGTTNAPVFAPYKNNEKIEEYKLITDLNKNTAIKVYGSNDTWHPSGEYNNYTVSADGTYSVYFRPNADGGDNWHENVFTLVEHTHSYTASWDWNDDGDDVSASAILTCSECGRQETVEATVTQVVDTPASCITEGSGHYKAAVEYDGQTFTDTDTSHTYVIPVDPDAHDYNVDWTWDGYESATAHITCNNCEYDETITDSVISSEVTQQPDGRYWGTRAYYASVETSTGAEFRDTKTEGIEPYQEAYFGTGTIYTNSFKNCADVVLTNTSSLLDFSDRILNLAKNVSDPYTFPTDTPYTTLYVRRFGYSVTINAPEGYDLIESEPDNDGVTTYSIAPDNKVVVSYLDENGEEQNVRARKVTADTTVMNNDWYIMQGDLTFDHDIDLKGDVRLILADGFEGNMGEYDLYDYMLQNSSLTVYRQSGDELGELEADSIGAENITMIGGSLIATNVDTRTSLTINGGSVAISKSVYVIDGDAVINGGQLIGGNAEDNTLDAKNVTINGGHVWLRGNTCIMALSGTIEVTGGNVYLNGDGSGMYANDVVISGGDVSAAALTEHNAVYAYNSIKLNWTEDSKASMRLNIHDFYCKNGVTVSKAFIDDDDDVYLPGKYGSDALTNKELKPHDSLFVRHNLTLEGDIGVCFYLYLSSEQLALEPVVSFTLGGKELPDYTIDPVKDQKTVGGYTLYRATCYVSAPEMADDITAVLTLNGEEVCTDTYSVMTYAKKILSDDYKTDYLAVEGNTVDKYNELASLVTAMLNYGGAAQVQFEDQHPNDGCGYADEGLDDPEALTADELNAIDMPAPDKAAINAQLTGTGLSCYGYTMLLHTKTTLRFYFLKAQPDTDISGIHLSIGTGDDKVTYSAKNYNDHFAYVEVEGIPAYELNNAYTLSVNDIDLGSYSALTYVEDVLTDESADEDLIDTVTAMYRYHEAAVAYFTHNNG